MGTVKQINIKNQTYYFYNDINDLENFKSNLLKIDKKSYKDIDIYNFGYITIKLMIVKLFTAWIFYICVVIYLNCGCHDLMQKAMSFNNIAIVYVEGSAYRIHFWYMSRDDAVNIMNGSNLTDKRGAL